MQFLCSARNRPVLLVMPDCKWLKLLTVNCQGTEPKPDDNNQEEVHTNYKVNSEADYFVAGPNTEPVTRGTNAKITIKVHNEFSNVFTGIRCFKGTFLLKVKENAKPYQVPPRCVAYTLQEPFKRVRKTTTKVNTGATRVDETGECCNSSITVPIPNGRV